MENPVTDKPQRKSRIEELDDEVRELGERLHLASPNHFTEPLNLPGDLVPGIMANRPELVRLAKPRALDEAECRDLYRALASLIETNAILREHTERVAHLVSNWSASFTQLSSIGGQIERFANFRTSDDGTTG
jgi:hypothetical protein